LSVGEMKSSLPPRALRLTIAKVIAVQNLEQCG
jgi:hypothetical protein